MKKNSIFTLISIYLLLFINSSLIAQDGHLADWLESKYNIDVRKNFTTSPIEPLSLTPDSRFALNSWVKADGGKILNVDAAVVQNILTNSPATLALNVPSEDGRIYKLQLVKVNLFAQGFNIKNSKNEIIKSKNKDVHYQGIVKGNRKSIAAVSFLNDGSISGLISQGKGNVVIGKLSNSTQHIIYNQKDVIPTLASACFMDDRTNVPNENINWTKVATESASTTCKTINVYFECDYDLFTKKGSSIPNTVTYMSGVFNQVSTLYANDAMDMVMSEIKVWDVTDPYASISSTSTLVNQFKSNLNGNFNGHIAHFISGRISTLGGGIAYTIPTEICTKANQCCVSAIYDTYSNVPTYSWTVNVITHEMGHILGSRHTHWCGWSGGPIDGCSGFAESDSLGNSCSVGPIPAAGGTIMSYCHQQSVGINLNLGFGPQPGNIIRYKISVASCIPSQSVTTPPTNPTTVSVFGKRATIQWNAVSGASFYQVEYKVANSNSWIYSGQTNLTTFTISNLNFSTAYNWRVKENCSPFATTQSFTTLANELLIASPFSITSICKNNFVTFNYTAENFLNGNQITVQLSDANGNFNNPTNVGLITSSTSGVISALIPSSIPDGAGYKFRLKSSLPISYSVPSPSFTVSGASQVNFQNISTSNPSDNSFRIWASADQPSTAYYVVLFNTNTTVPTAAQIIAGKDASGNNALQKGSFSLQNTNTNYHKIVSDLPPGSSFIVFLTLDNQTICQKPIVAEFISTTGSNPIPMVCIPLFDCTDEDYVNSFTVSSLGINTLNSGCSAGGYADRTTTLYNVQKNSTYPFSLTTGFYSEYLVIWIDYNQNGTFETSEITYQSTGKANTHTGSISIPNLSTNGFMKMRVIVRFSSSDLTVPCSVSNYFGEAEDYLLYLSNTVPCPSLTTLTSPTNDVMNGIGKVYRGEAISATNKISASSAGEYYGTKSITLNPGFAADSNTIFKAVIDSNCGN